MEGLLRVTTHWSVGKQSREPGALQGMWRIGDSVLCKPALNKLDF